MYRSSIASRGKQPGGARAAKHVAGEIHGGAADRAQRGVGFSAALARIVGECEERADDVAGGAILEARPPFAPILDDDVADVGTCGPGDDGIPNPTLLNPAVVDRQVRAALLAEYRSRVAGEEEILCRDVVRLVRDRQAVVACARRRHVGEDDVVRIGALRAQIVVAVAYA